MTWSSQELYVARWGAPTKTDDHAGAQGNDGILYNLLLVVGSDGCPFSGREKERFWSQGGSATSRRSARQRWHLV